MKSYTAALLILNFDLKIISSNSIKHFFLTICYYIVTSYYCFITVWL